MSSSPAEQRGSFFSRLQRALRTSQAPCPGRGRLKPSDLLNPPDRKPSPKSKDAFGGDRSIVPVPHAGASSDCRGPPGWDQGPERKASQGPLGGGWKGRPGSPYLRIRRQAQWPHLTTLQTRWCICPPTRLRGTSPGRRWWLRAGWGGGCSGNRKRLIHLLSETGPGT